MSATRKVTTNLNWNRCFASIGFSTSFNSTFPSFLSCKNRTLLYLPILFELLISQMLNFFNTLGSEVQNHTVQTSETYNLKEHIHKRSVLDAHFFISLYLQIWSICCRPIKFILKKFKHKESIFPQSFVLICFTKINTHLLYRKMIHQEFDG